MASLCLLLLSATLIHSAQSLPAARGKGRGPDVSLGGIRRQRRDIHDLLPYEDQMMSYPVQRSVGGVNDLYYQPEGWKGRGLDQALQQLVERDQRREEEEEEDQRAAYLAALLRLLSEAERAGLVGPGDVEVAEEEEEEDEQGPPSDFQESSLPDYDDMGRVMSMGRPPADWWRLLQPQQAQALLNRMEPQLVQSLLQRGRETSGQTERDTLRQLVARILTSIGPNAAPVGISSGRRARRDLSVKAAEPLVPAHKRTRRSLDDVTPPSPSNDPPLLRVKRLRDEEEEHEERLRPQLAGLQRMKRIDAMATADAEEVDHGSRRRRRRAALNYDPQILIDQIIQYMRE